MWFVKVLLLLVCCNSLLLNAAERQDPTKPSLAIAHKSSTTEQVLVSEQLNLNAIKLDGKHKIAIIWNVIIIIKISTVVSNVLWKFSNCFPTRVFKYPSVIFAQYITEIISLNFSFK